MKRRWFALSGLLGLSALSLQAVTGCSSGTRGNDGSEALGTINVPLGAYAESGTRYRLRNAEFVIEDIYSGGYSGEGGGASSGGSAIVLSSEDDLDADSIGVSVEQGYYYVRLRPGWRMEKQEANGTHSDVEAQLLSGSSQWVYVSPRSSRWVEFAFGIGNREIWFNGDLNIQISVYEDPDDYYGEGYSGGGGSVGSVGGSAGSGGGGTGGIGGFGGAAD